MDNHRDKPLWQRICNDVPNVHVWSLDNGKVLVRSTRNKDSNRLASLIERFCSYVEIVEINESGKHEGVIVKEK